MSDCLGEPKGFTRVHDVSHIKVYVKSVKHDEAGRFTENSCVSKVYNLVKPVKAVFVLFCMYTCLCIGIYMLFILRKDGRVFLKDGHLFKKQFGVLWEKPQSLFICKTSSEF